MGEMGTYMAAAVCRRGHPASSDTGFIAPPTRCPKCGAAVLTSCERCGHRIRGRFENPGVMVIGGPAYKPPDFCDECGTPHPWASRQARIYELENLLDEQNLDPADRLTVQENLAALREPDVPEEEQRQRWERVKKLAPGLMAAGERIIETVVSAAIKAQLGL